MPATAIPTARPAATPTTAPAATAWPNTGNVTGPGAPDFSVEPVSGQTIRVTLAAPDAKAWRLTVAGTGDQSADAWTFEVETGDILPGITTTETVGGKAGEAKLQEKLAMGTAKGRVCSTTLPVCVIAKSVELPADGNATLVLDLVRTDAAAPLSVTAATATWDGDPFVLGPWTVTEAFAWAI